MTDRQIDDILSKAARPPQPVDAEVLDRITRSIPSTLDPVRPLPPNWILTAALAAVCIGVAIAGAAHLGFFGLQLLTAGQRALIFTSLALFVWLSADQLVREMIPGSKRRADSRLLLVAGSTALIALFGTQFHDYRNVRFLHAGIVCLTAGLLFAIPTALAAWLILRRGFAVNPATAGLMAGTLSGLAGLTMLELHCANFEVLHLMVWHSAVVLISATIGAIAGRTLRRRTD